VVCGECMFGGEGVWGDEGRDVSCKYVDVRAPWDPRLLFYQNLSVGCAPARRFEVLPCRFIE